MNMLDAIRALNAVLAFGVEGLAVAQQIGAIIEAAQSEDRPISAEEWAAVTAEADKADAQLAAHIQAKSGA